MTNSSEAFKKDLLIGQETENKILLSLRKKYPTAVLVPGKFKPYDIFIPEKNLKVEVKVDYKSQDTGNILIELFMFGKPSALLTTEADFWIIKATTKTFWITPKKIIECIMINNIRSQSILGSGDDQEKIACLIPIDIFRKYTI